MQHVEVPRDLHDHYLVRPAKGPGQHMLVVLARIAAREWGCHGQVPAGWSRAEALEPIAGFPVAWCRAALLALVESRAIAGSEGAGWAIHPELWGEFARSILAKQERDRLRYARQSGAGGEIPPAESGGRIPSLFAPDSAADRPTDRPKKKSTRAVRAAPPLLAPSIVGARPQAARAPRGNPGVTTCVDAFRRHVPTWRCDGKSAAHLKRLCAAYTTGRVATWIDDLWGRVQADAFLAKLGYGVSALLQCERAFAAVDAGATIPTVTRASGKLSDEGRALLDASLGVARPPAITKGGA